MNEQVLNVLNEYHLRMKSEGVVMGSLSPQEMMDRRDEFLLPVGREVGQFIHSLAKSSKAKTILEIGTSYGYSTVWLAAAAKETNAKVITLELDEQKSEYAKAQLEKAGLVDYVDFRVGDALQSIKESSEKFDFVLLDIWKSLYIPCFELFYTKLNNVAFVVADNIIHPPNYKLEMEKYRNTVKETQSFDSVLLPIGSGLEVSCLRT